MCRTEKCTHHTKSLTLVDINCKHWHWQVWEEGIPCAAPRPKFLHFHAVFRKNGQIIGWRLLRGWRPVLEILDPPLIGVRVGIGVGVSLWESLVRRWLIFGVVLPQLSASLCKFTIIKYVSCRDDELLVYDATFIRTLVTFCDKCYVINVQIA